eukprot:3283108-Heterocapsa_arctica.AAC.1
MVEEMKRQQQEVSHHRGQVASRLLRMASVPGAIRRCALAIQGIEASGSRSSRTSKGPTTSALSTRQ